VIAGGILLGGCVPAEAGAAHDAAADFQTRVAAQDWPGACTLLSDQARSQLESTAARSCGEALSALRLPSGPAGAVEVWGRNAEVRIDADAVFLSRFTTGWRVIAAGCEWRGEDLPYDCAVRG
jgi:hypothetical protein